MNEKESLMEEILSIRYESAEKERELCLRLLDCSDDDYTQAFARTYLGDAFHSLGLLESALRECLKALEISEKNRYEKLMLTLCNIIGIIYITIEDEQSSLDYYYRAMRLAGEVNDTMMSSMIMANIASIYNKFGEYNKAMINLNKAYEIANSATDGDSHLKYADTFFNGNKADIAISCGNYEEGLRYLKNTNIDPETTCDTRILILYAYYYTGIQDKDNALKYIDRVIKLIEHDNNSMYMMSYYFDITEMYLKLCEYESAKIYANKLEKVLRNMNIPGKWVKLLELEIKIYTALGDEEKLNEAYQNFFEKDKEFNEARMKTGVKRLKRRIELQNELDKHSDMQAKQEQLISMSENDELTNVLNRRGLRKKLDDMYQKAKEEASLLAVMIIDVDYFKEFNDTYGHLAGDDCLRKIASALRDSVGMDGIVGRYGGDEFMIVVSGIERARLVNLIARIRDSIDELFIININSKVSEFITVTIGVINTIPSDNTDILEYMHAADSALYEIKKKSRNGFHITDTL